MNDSVSKSASAYGNAGLLPFVAAAALVWILPEQQAVLTSQVFASYSSIILSFMAGTLWGSALRSEAPIPALKAVQSAIAFSLLAWASLIMAMSNSQLFAEALSISLALNMGGFFLLRQSERKYCDPDYSEAYSQLRNTLTRIVGASHISVVVFALQL